MKAEIFLSGENHNPINLDGTLVEFMQGSDGSTVVLEGGQNWKKLGNLFGEIRNQNGGTLKEHYFNRTGMVKNSVCILEDSTETIYFPVPVRIHIGV